jgi:hypothetical protein
LTFLSKEVRFRIFFSAQQKCIVLRHFSGYMGCLSCLFEIRRSGCLPAKNSREIPSCLIFRQKIDRAGPTLDRSKHPAPAGFRFSSEMPGWRATSAGRSSQPSQPRHAFEPFERIEEFESLAQIMSAMAALIKAHSDPGFDKSSIHFTRPARPREDRNPLIWKHSRQKVSRFRAASAGNAAGRAEEWSRECGGNA